MTRIPSILILAALVILPARAQYDYWSLKDRPEATRGVSPETVAGIQKWTQVLNQNPNNANALLQRGLLYGEAARMTPLYRHHYLYAASKDLERAIQLDPNNFYARHSYADVCYRNGDALPGQPAMHIAVREFTKAIELNPKSARSYMGRGFANLMLNDEGRAKADFDRALQLDPSLQRDITSEVNSIHEHHRQVAAGMSDIRHAGNYYVEPRAATQRDCEVVYHGRWVAAMPHPECQVSDPSGPIHSHDSSPSGHSGGARR